MAGWNPSSCSSLHHMLKKKIGKSSFEICHSASHGQTEEKYTKTILSLTRLSYTTYVPLSMPFSIFIIESSIAALSHGMQAWNGLM